jgi:hypothetical protein
MAQIRDRTEETPPAAIRLQHAIDLARDLSVTDEASKAIGDFLDDNPGIVLVRYVLMALLDLTR